MKKTLWIRAVLIALGCAVIVYAATYLVRPRYAVTESLYFPLSQDSAGGLGFRPTAQGDSSVSTFQGALSSPLVGAKTQTAIGILESRSCAAYLVSAANLAKHYGVSPQKAIGVVHLRLRTDTDKNGFLKVDYEDEDKGVGVEVLKKAQSYLGLMSEKLSLNLSQKNLAFVQARIKQVRADLAKKQLTLAMATAKNPSANPDLLQKNLLDIRNEYDVARSQAAGAQAEIAQSEHIYRQILAGANTFAGRMIALGLYENLSYLSDDLQKRRLALVDAAAKYRSSDPDLRAVQRDQADANGVAGSLVDAQKIDLKQGVTPKLTEAKSRLASLEATTAAYGSIIAKLDDEFVRSAVDAGDIASASRDFKSGSDRLTELERELDLSMVAVERNPERFQVVDAPYATGEVAFPKRTMIAFLVFVVVLCAQLAFVRAAAPK
jgi:hypothetical protein